MYKIRMKRKQMIQIMMDAYDYAIKNKSTSEEEMFDHILTKMEDAGMLPPEGSFLFERQIGDIKISYPFTKHQWEPP